MIRKIIIMVLSITLLVMLFLTSLHDLTILVVEDQKTGEARRLYPESNHFELGYTHSILLTPVDEFFEITEDKKLILVKTVYESFGVGLPYEQLSDADFEIIDDQFIYYLNRNFDVINMVISPIPQHTITVNDVAFNILELFDTSTDARRIKIFIETGKVFEIGNYRVVL